MTSALLRRGAGGLLALAAAVSEALARGWLGTAGAAAPAAGGGWPSRRTVCSNSMTSPGMKAPTHTPIHTRMLPMHTNWHSAILLLLCHFPLLDCFSPHTSGFLKAAMSSTELPFKGVFIGPLTWTVSGRHRGSFMLPITLPCRLVASISACLLVFYPRSLRLSPNQTPLMNREADICRKATTTLM